MVFWKSRTETSHNFPSSMGVKLTKTVGKRRLGNARCPLFSCPDAVHGKVQWDNGYFCIFWKWVKTLSILDSFQKHWANLGYRLKYMRKWKLAPFLLLWTRHWQGKMKERLWFNWIYGFRPKGLKCLLSSRKTLGFHSIVLAVQGCADF